MELEEKIEQPKLPIITIVLVVINVVAYLLTEIFGSSLDSEFMIQAGAMYEPAFIDRGEYYRIITCFFLHFGLDHLLNNMVSLLVLGYALESVIGKTRFLVIYFLSGIFAGMVSVWYHLYTGQEIVSCGASGAIYGLMGALLIVLLVYKRDEIRGEAPRFLLYIVLSLYSGMTDPGIDNAAHVGGFIGGLILCGILCGLNQFLRIERNR